MYLHFYLWYIRNLRVCLWNKKLVYCREVKKYIYTYPARFLVNIQ